MKSVLLLLVLLAIFDACVSCKEKPNCIPRGGFCHPGNWKDCCCPDGCLGFIMGACYGNTRKLEGVNGIMAYSIYDAANNKLIQDTVVLDSTTIASQAQLDRIKALYGNQTVYMDAHIDIYSDDDAETIHRSWRHYKISGETPESLDSENGVQ